MKNQKITKQELENIVIAATVQGLWSQTSFLFDSEKTKDEKEAATKAVLSTVKIALQQNDITLTPEHEDILSKIIYEAGEKMAEEVKNDPQIKKDIDIIQAQIKGIMDSDGYKKAEKDYKQNSNFIEQIMKIKSTLSNVESSIDYAEGIQEIMGNVDLYCKSIEKLRALNLSLEDIGVITKNYTVLNSNLTNYNNKSLEQTLDPEDIKNLLKQSLGEDKLGKSPLNTLLDLKAPGGDTTIKDIDNNYRQYQEKIGGIIKGLTDGQDVDLDTFKEQLINKARKNNDNTHNTLSDQQIKQINEKSDLQKASQEIREKLTQTSIKQKMVDLDQKNSNSPQSTFMNDQKNSNHHNPIVKFILAIIQALRAIPNVFVSKEEERVNDKADKAAQTLTKGVHSFVEALAKEKTNKERVKG